MFSTISQKNIDTLPPQRKVVLFAPSKFTMIPKRQHPEEESIIVLPQTIDAIPDRSPILNLMENQSSVESIAKALELAKTKELEHVGPKKEHVLLHAIRMRNTPTVQLLLTHPKTTHLLTKKNRGELPLHFAISQRYFEGAALMLNRNINYTLTNHMRRNILHVAIIAKELQLLLLLLNTIKPEIINELMEKEDRYNRHPIFYVFLTTRKSENWQNPTLLHTCFSANDREVYNLFLPRISSQLIHHPDKFKKTIVHYAAGFFPVDIFAQLLAMGGKEKINTSDVYLKTPLHDAVIGGNGPIIKILLQEGAIDQKTIQDETAFEIATELRGKVWAKQMFLLSEDDTLHKVASMEMSVQTLDVPAANTNYKTPNQTNREETKKKWITANRSQLYRYDSATPQQDLDAPSPFKGGGKWMVFCHDHDVDAKWQIIEKAVNEGILYAAKVSTKSQNSYNSYVIIVYTPNCNDLADIIKVLDYLESNNIYNKKKTIYYKADEQTAANTYSGGKQKPWIYSSTTIRELYQQRLISEKTASACSTYTKTPILTSFKKDTSSGKTNESKPPESNLEAVASLSSPLYKKLKMQ